MARRGDPAAFRLGSVVAGLGERGFATMKRHYGYRRVRYLGLARNRGQLNLMCTAINLRRPPWPPDATRAPDEHISTIIARENPMK